MTKTGAVEPSIDEVIKYLETVRNGINSNTDGCCRIFKLGKDKCDGFCPLMDLPGWEGLCGLSVIISSLKGERKNIRTVSDFCKMNPGDKYSLDKRIAALEEVSIHYQTLLSDHAVKLAIIEKWRKS